MTENILEKNFCAKRAKDELKTYTPRSHKKGGGGWIWQKLKVGICAVYKRDNMAYLRATES